MITDVNQINYTSKNVHVLKTPKEIAQQVAHRIASLIRQKQTENKQCVLCLPTGSTPVLTYRELIRLHQEEGLSFKNVITFNLDEYYPMQPTEKNSYHKFMNDTFFKHVDVPKENIHIPDGTLPLEQVDAFCHDYEEKIRQAGGFDLALVGIGRTGHIGFNEPPSSITDRTRLVTLHNTTRVDAASAFGGEAHVPFKAITMGIGTIFDAKEIILIATGENKADIVKVAVEKKLESASDCPAAYLRLHKNCRFYFDEAAGCYLKRVQCPWIVLGPDQDFHTFWSDFQMRKRAVVECSFSAKKAICDLTDADFYAHDLSSLVIYSKGEIDSLCREIFEHLLSKITLQKNQTELIPCDPSEKILIFSPHPDDDVICIGGLMYRLAKYRKQLLRQQNPELPDDSSVDTNIRVAYMTNGSVAVADNVLRYHLRFAKALIPDYIDPNAVQIDMQQIIDQTLFGSESREANVNNNQFVDSQVRQKLKGGIRRAEAMNAVEQLGMNGDRDCIFLDLPFYHTGKVEKNPLSENDVNIVRDLLIKENPKHVFIAADLTDPHGTHRLCYFAIKEALDQLYPKEKRAEHTDKMNVWLYRGAWQEFDPCEASVFLPMSRSEMNTKIHSIYAHQSQKHTALYPGDDPREFYQRAQDRNTQTAELLNHLGLPAFYACEAFVRIEPEDLPM